MLDDLSLVDMLSKVNGIYLAGDSHKSIINTQYRDTFNLLIKYCDERYHKHGDYFPIFLMGKSA